jgi:hypothetical protein
MKLVDRQGYRSKCIYIFLLQKSLIRATHE